MNVVMNIQINVLLPIYTNKKYYVNVYSTFMKDSGFPWS